MLTCTNHTHAHTAEPDKLGSDTHMLQQAKWLVATATANRDKKPVVIIIIIIIILQASGPGVIEGTDRAGRSQAVSHHCR